MSAPERDLFVQQAANSSQAKAGSSTRRLDWQRQSTALVGMTSDFGKGMKAYLNRRYRFSASHRLHSEHMSDAENQATYGKCNNPHGHGHNYVLEVTVSGQVDESTGMICNLVDLDEWVDREIVTRFDLENLNMRPEFEDFVPTTENLCTVIYDILKRKFPPAHLEKVRLEETMMNAFEVSF